MDSLVAADSNENEKARILRITLSTAFEDAASPYVRCFINKLKYGTTYSDYIEKKITKLEKEFVLSTWGDLKTNYNDNKESIEEEIGRVDQAIDDLVDINIREEPEAEVPLAPEELELPKISAKPERIPVPVERKEEVSKIEEKSERKLEDDGGVERSEDEESQDEEENNGSESEGSEEVSENGNENDKSEERAPFAMAEEEGAESENDE